MDRALEVLAITGAVLGILAVLTLVLVRFQRGLERPGGRDGLGSIGDAFGNFIDVFDPAQARAQRELKHQEHQGPVTPSPDEDDDRPVTLVRNPDGTPRAVRIRRPPPPT